MAAYWWASQDQTRSAIDEGTLWTCLTKDGAGIPGRTRIKELEVGDLVFNYAGGSVRAVSRVVAEWVTAPRPSSHPGRDGDPDVGWLVRTELTATRLSLAWQEVKELLASIASPGPFDKDGMPGQRYISVITEEDGPRLLERLGITAEALETPPADRPPVDTLWDLGETDAVTIGRCRREQARLREYLLGRRATASCDICGRELPAALLVAAHIVPRADSDEEHRKDFASIAMVACSLGCDDLFELGYIVVDEAGIVKAGRATDTPSLGSAIELLSDNICTAYNEHTAADFAEHARLIRA